MMINDLGGSDLSKIWIRLFQTYKIELIGNHITVNGIQYFFNESNITTNNLNEEEKPYLCYNKYGQCHIEQNGKRQIFFNMQDIKKISFTAIDMFGKKQDNGRYYNTLWFFTR